MFLEHLMNVNCDTILPKNSPEAQVKPLQPIVAQHRVWQSSAVLVLCSKPLLMFGPLKSVSYFKQFAENANWRFIERKHSNKMAAILLQNYQQTD